MPSSAYALCGSPVALLLRVLVLGLGLTFLKYLVSRGTGTETSCRFQQCPIFVILTALQKVQLEKGKGQAVCGLSNNQVDPRNKRAGAECSAGKHLHFEDANVDRRQPKCAYGYVTAAEAGEEKPLNDHQARSTRRVVDIDLHVCDGSAKDGGVFLQEILS